MRHFDLELQAERGITLHTVPVDLRFFFIAARTMIDNGREHGRHRKEISRMEEVGGSRRSLDVSLAARWKYHLEL